MTQKTRSQEKMKLKEPSYYSILPADIRYNENLSSSAKLLFSEITALCSKSGKCWASNAYFARLYKVHASTISAWVAELVKEGCIDTYTEDKVRVIAIGKTLIALREKTQTPGRKDEGGMGENASQNNTSINIKKNNNNTWLKTAINFYSLFWEETYGTKPEAINWGRLGKSLLPLKSLNEWQMATLIWLHFNWYGASGDDKRIHKNLADNFFPLDWLPRASDGYKAYLINSLEVDWNNEEAVKKFILPELKKANGLTER